MNDSLFTGEVVSKLEITASSAVGARRAVPWQL